MPHSPPARRRTRQSASSPPKEPETTPSGVVPGRALFDTPPPGEEPVQLDRSQRTRKVSTRGLESQTQADSEAVRRRALALKRKVRRARAQAARSSPPSTDDEVEDPDTGEAGDASSPRPVANEGPSAGNNRMAGDSQAGTGSITFFRKNDVLYDLSRILGQDVSHLSTQQIEKLFNAIPNPETQVSALGNEERRSTVIVQPAAPLGVGGGYYRDRLGPEGSANSLQAAEPPGERTAPSLKRARFDIGVDGSTTESESEPEEPNLLALLARPPSRWLEGLDSQPNHLPTPAPSDKPASTTSKQADAPPVEGPDTATESESEVESEIRSSQSESEPEPEASAPTNHIESSNRRGTQPASTPSTSSQSKTSAPPASASSSPPSSHARASTQPLASSSATGVAQLGPSQDRVLAQLQPALPDRDVNQLLNAILQLTEARTRQQASSSTGPSASTSAGPAGATHRTVVNVGLRHQPNRPQAAGQIRVGSPVDDPAEVLEQAAAALLGKVRSRRKRPGLSDFPGIRRQIASAAIPVMQTKAIVRDPFASPDTCEDWARDAYDEMWYEHVPNQPFEPAPPGLCKVIACRGSHFRCKLKERIRPVVCWGFGFRTPINSNDDIRHNKRLARKLKSDTFHCLDLEPDTNQYEHPLFVRCIAEGFFWDLNSIGVLYYPKFNPIPLPAAALILAMMQFCISEWRSGRHQTFDINLSQLTNIYDAHLQGLEIYGEQAALRLDSFRRRWFKFGMSHAGAVLVKRRRIAHPVTRAENVRPDTPPVDEEAHRSKGKGRAAN